jgi:hypothetical protein
LILLGQGPVFNQPNDIGLILLCLKHYTELIKAGIKFNSAAPEADATNFWGICFGLFKVSFWLGNCFGYFSKRLGNFLKSSGHPAHKVTM